MSRSNGVPKHFLSLQELGIPCQNYYTGPGGEKIGLTPEILRQLGLHDDTLWVHPSVLSKLEMASMRISDQGFNILVKDAWRPVALYQKIISLRRERGLQVEGLINGVSMPHATGLAVDVVLADPKTKQPVMMRNHKRDGHDSIYLNHYLRKPGNDCREFQRLQDILVYAFLGVGFRLGSNREYWHFELPGIEEAIKF